MLGIDAYLWLKWLHILGSTILFGTGIGTAFQMWFAHRSGDPAAIAVVARNVVLADWLFTLPAGVVQPITGAALVLQSGVDLFASWLVASYALYLLALACGCRWSSCRFKRAIWRRTPPEAAGRFLRGITAPCTYGSCWVGRPSSPWSPSSC